MLENHVYAGDLAQGKSTSFCRKQTRITDKSKWIIVENTHEAIISREQFNAVQEYRKQLNERAKKRVVEPYTPNIFLTKIFCGHCGIPMHRHRYKYKHSEAYYFNCPTNSRVAQGSCLNPSIRENDVIATVITALKAQADVVVDRENVLSKIVTSDSYKEKRAKELSDLKRFISKNKDYLISLYENLINENIKVDEYKSLKIDYEQKISETVKKIHDIENQHKELESQYEKFLGYFGDIKDILKNKQLTAELIKNLIDKILIFKDKRIEITFGFEDELKVESGAIINE